MAYMRFWDANSPAQWNGAGRGRCDSLDRLAADQRNTIAEFCPVCRGEPGRCLVEVMQEVVAAARPTDKDDGAPLPI